MSNIIITPLTGSLTTEEISVRPNEKEIYQKMWDIEEYRKKSPGEACVMEFLSQAKPKAGSTVVDIGCGTGRAGMALAIVGNLKVTFIDFAENCLDKDMKEMIDGQPHLSFIEADLTNGKLPIVAEYGFCTDVMEHIPPDKVQRALDNILLACKHVFFQIATFPDGFGAAIGHPLHLSIHPYAWWLERFTERGAIIHWGKSDNGRCSFYVTAWAEGKDIVDSGRLNVTEEIIRENVKTNIANGWMQVTPHSSNELECMILGGGWSLPEFQAEIASNRAKGMKLIVLNGAYGWCLERGYNPSALIMVDARPHNSRFPKPVIDGCKYLMASQVHPSVLEGLPKDRTYLFHTGAEVIKDLLNAQYKDSEGLSEWYPVPGGSTVLLRAIPLMRMLGYKNFHLYGCDSCLSPEKAHHAYAQLENDSEVIFPVTVNSSEQVFYAHAWMISQAQEFIDLIRFIGDEIELCVHGNGLLNHILNTGAELLNKET